MHNSVQKYKDIISAINKKLEEQKINYIPKIIAVSKTFKLEKILPLIEYGHLDYGENKVQEAIDKWSEIKLKKQNIKLHLIGKLQTNKVKHALKIFDYIHSVDNMKLAKKIADEQIKQNKNLKLFIQVNIGDEEQKSGIKVEQVKDLIIFSKQLNLNIVGLMCIPPVNEEPDKYFKEINILSKKFNLQEISMGMSSDYLKAVENSSTYLRIGSSIFGQRT
ncbi:YggS family pyridoxal phosphate-dependent enzyme [Candidatus Pelagibacter sp.]|jgi:PLP dependent protein|nr:YggS family pyridoxal phosphate-dependent enzyme [Candidatus Pelagibacter sp.]MDC1040956.1 YggS family pyridoxal phosphate-dependent enzyme [Candidatus Pelagibacter sp.]